MRTVSASVIKLHIMFGCHIMMIGDYLNLGSKVKVTVTLNVVMGQWDKVEILHFPAQFLRDLNKMWSEHHIVLLCMR